MTSDIKLRWATQNDYELVGEVMFDAVRNGRSQYSDAQREAWVPQARTGTLWEKRLSEQSIIVAINSAQIVGFMSLAPKSYLDFAYVRPAFQGQGLFRRMYEKIEKLALEQKQPRIWVHASLMAQPAFSKIGFNIIKKENVEIAKETFERFEMEKHLNHSSFSGNPN